MRKVPALAFPSLRLAWHMVQRNLIVYRHLWIILLSGFFEPVFYLLGMGLGVGGMVGDLDGLSYAAFVMPGLMAAHCMNGALADGFFNIFFKLHFEKTYDGVLATPMRVPDIALGEMLWAIARGSGYATLFVIVVFVVGRTITSPMLLSPWAALAVPAAILVSASFSALALAATSFVRKIADFDIVFGTLVTPMFLFSGIFFPIERLPAGIALAARLVPLYHAVTMLRQLTTGAVDATILIHIVYLIAIGLIAFLIAMVRLERALVK
jgi:lipooligosaccharide transport system permease protein